jgi:hypothetical protein
MRHVCPSNKIDGYRKRADHWLATGRDRLPISTSLEQFFEHDPKRVDLVLHAED